MTQTGRYYIRPAEAYSEDTPEENQSYNLFDRHEQNDFGRDICLIAHGSYEECAIERDRLLNQDRSGRAN